jgi:rhamnosyltransferase
LENSDEKNILKEYSLKKNDYHLVVGRCVPENNFEMIIREFMKSKATKRLVIISNITGNKYYDELKQITNCDSDSRITILPGIYDEIKLSVIRKNAFSYIHGHSVGGTNPSLLEALSLTYLNILYDVNFNHQVGLDSCLYFYKEGSLTKLLNKEDYLVSIRKEKGKLAKKRIHDEYTWEYVVDKYEKLFK